MDSWRAFISPESLLNFFRNLYILLWSRKSFKIIVLRLLANTFVNQKIDFLNFHSCLQAKLSPRFLSPYFGQTGIAHSYRTTFFKILPPKENGGRGFWSWKITKINKDISHKFWYIPPSLQPLHFWFMFCCAII